MNDITKTVTNQPKERSFWIDVFFQLRKNKLAMISLFVLIFVVLASIFVPILSSHDIATTNTALARQAPCSVHWLGTDDLGRDMFVRFFYAGRISLSIALISTVLLCIVGVILGGIAGYYGGVWDAIIMRLTETFLCIPFILACIAAAAFLGSSIPVLIIIFTVLSWPVIARIVRGQILALRDLEYMQACEALGISDFRRIFKHLLPNVMAYIIVYATLSMASIILVEAALSFLGLGVSPPTPT